MKCKDCKYWREEDELPHITAFMECARVYDPDKYHFRGPEDSCEFGEAKQPDGLEKPAKENDEAKAKDGGKSVLFLHSESSNESTISEIAQSSFQKAVDERG